MSPNPSETRAALRLMPAPGPTNQPVVTQGEGVEAMIVVVSARGTEHDRVSADHPVGLTFRVLTGFPPRYFLRLEPR